jgi:membrane protease YdiL (CAAX protease family)
MFAVPDVLTAILLTLLVVVLGEILRAQVTETLFVPPQPRRRLQFDLAVLSAAVVLILLHVVPNLLHSLLSEAETAADKPVSPSPGAEILLRAVIVALLISLITARQNKNQLADYGIDSRGWLAEVRYGGLGFMASLPLVVGVIVLTTRWRSPETQNPLLILLHQTGSSWTLVGVVVAAVVAAPVSEELLFRVCFQSPLEARLPRAWAVGVPAFVFAGVHGIYDALPILPLALVLGVLYHLRRSYVAIVTAHALFNATFLILALAQR